MAFFTFPGEQEHRKFNYRPIYYDKDEEERRQVFGKVDGTFDAEKEKEKAAGEYKAGTYIRGALRDGNYARRSRSTVAQRIIGIVGLILLVIVMVYLCKFYALL